MSAVLRFPTPEAPICAECGHGAEDCDCVVLCGCCREQAWRAETRFFGWLGRDGHHVCDRCESRMERGK